MIQSKKNKYSHNIPVRSSQGFLIPMSAILILGIGVLAASINRMSSQSNSASIIEGVSVQAFYAAESGAYYGMSQLMFDVDDNATGDTNCNTINSSSASTISFSAAGLQNCTAIVRCAIDTVAGSLQHYYTIRSDASCGAGGIYAERSVEVSSFL